MHEERVWLVEDGESNSEYDSVGRKVPGLHKDNIAAVQSKEGKGKSTVSITVQVSLNTVSQSAS
jgi:hypothetical protein